MHNTKTYISFVFINSIKMNLNSNWICLLFWEPLESSTVVVIQVVLNHFIRSFLCYYIYIMFVSIWNLVSSFVSSFKSSFFGCLQLGGCAISPGRSIQQASFFSLCCYACLSLFARSPTKKHPAGKVLILFVVIHVFFLTNTSLFLVVTLILPA